ncbi:bifunctional DNA-formamidopyrimidine glycosylase/DNA-(apurinic or apyrimidinic site) lyase [Alphaproteobacteria bacterium]|nr:bifunctional DNA-formamidopyrimidine glycosylase/DNA-(apurinic or apyrimidinic site) lyase [Alphaproteobacteria bacterium]|tara:strand:+ start:1517 stop:2347 length:831 start_codon:yes stop_codon:yes gene_type:complete
MPELPEVETVMRGIQPALEGMKLINVEQRCAKLRWRIPYNLVIRLKGRRVTGIARRAKYIIWYFDNETAMILHLGMSGRISITSHRPAVLEKHDHLIFTIEDGTVIRFNDARRFGMVDLVPSDQIFQHRLLKSLGPEPLGNDFSSIGLGAMLEGKQQPIKNALLDQSVVAGLGNIYVCESLYRSNISPRRLAMNVKGRRLGELFVNIKDILNEAIIAGGSTLRDHAQTNGDLGYFQHNFMVYGREGEACKKSGCVGEIKRIIQSGRSTFYCAKCQR